MIIRLTGLKEACGDYNRFRKRTAWYLKNNILIDGYAHIVFSKKTGRLWADCYTNSSDWTDYDKDYIFVDSEINEYNREHGTSYRTTMADVRKFIREVL